MGEDGMRNSSTHLYIDHDASRDIHIRLYSGKQVPLARFGCTRAMDDTLAQQYAERIQAQELLTQVRFVSTRRVYVLNSQPNVTSALVASNVGLTIQALLTGSCLQLVSAKPGCRTPLGPCGALLTDRPGRTSDPAMIPSSLASPSAGSFSSLYSASRSRICSCRC